MSRDEHSAQVDLDTPLRLNRLVICVRPALPVSYIYRTVRPGELLQLDYLKLHTTTIRLQQRNVS
jgi:hypothetical protein